MRRRASYLNLLGSTGNTLIVSLQALLLVPLYIVEIGPRMYGAWLGTGEVLVWMQALDLGLPLIMLQRMASAHARGDRATVGSGFASAFLALVAVALLLLAAAFALAGVLPGWMGLAEDESSELVRAFRIGAVAVVFNILNLNVQVLAKAMQRTGFVNLTLVASGLVGVATSLVLLLRGYGLLAIALGMVARALCNSVGGVVFVADAVRRGTVAIALPDLRLLRDMLRLSPITALAGVSYALMNQSEAALIAILVDPALSAVYVLTRRALDVAGMLLDSIGHSAFGAFAHLVGSGERERALLVHSELASLRLSLAVAAAATYLLLNRSFVTVWVGAAQFGGSLLTLLLGMRMLVAGTSYFLNFMYRAAGEIRKGSLLLVGEAALRLPLMAAFLALWGLPGLPVASMLVAAVFGTICLARTRAVLLPFSVPAPPPSARLRVARLALLLAGAAGGWMLARPSWIFVGATAAVFFPGSALLLVALDRGQERLRSDARNLGKLVRSGMTGKREVVS